MERMGGGPTPEEMAKKNEPEERVKSLGSQLHEEWRKPRWREESKDYEPRIKKTKDQAWSQAHGGAMEVDIANTPYEGLPNEWQGENKISAEVAVTEVEKAIEAGVPLDESFIEAASSTLHDKWRERRITAGYNQGTLDAMKAKTERTSEDQAYVDKWSYDQKNMVPYTSLSEEEKEKDRVIIRKAIEVCSKKE